MAALLLAAWNVGSAAVEAALLTSVHRANRQALLAPKTPPKTPEASPSQPRAPQQSRAVYGRQPVARGGLGLGLGLGLG